MIPASVLIAGCAYGLILFYDIQTYKNGKMLQIPVVYDSIPDGQ
jgi:hypothetical protein